MGRHWRGAPGTGGAIPQPFPIRPSRFLPIGARSEGTRAIGWLYGRRGSAEWSRTPDGADPSGAMVELRDTADHAQKDGIPELQNASSYAVLGPRNSAPRSCSH